MPFPSIDLQKVKTYPLVRRESLVHEDDLIFTSDLSRLDAFLDLPELVERMISARREGFPVIWMIGGHVVKSGLSPILISLMEKGIITHIASNGAASIHDFEIAMQGKTSEDVNTSLNDGSFGMAEETGRLMNVAIQRGCWDGLGAGEALGKFISTSEEFPHRKESLLYNAYRIGIPYTVHIAIGTDIIHQHPQADFAALGWASGQDFKIFTYSVSKLGEGVFCNFGSAVIGPEVFLKALSISRNMGNPLKHITTANFDLLPLSADYHKMSAKDDPEYYYRPKKNIVIRPTAIGGKGFHICGDHKETIPLIHHLITTSNAGPFPDKPVKRIELLQDDAIKAEHRSGSPDVNAVLEKWSKNWPQITDSEAQIRQSFNLLACSLGNSRTLFICGNGGSFADAVHIAGELNKSYLLNRHLDPADKKPFSNFSDGDKLANALQQGIRTIVLGTNPALSSAIDNDSDVKSLYFAQELNSLARQDDILLAISTSGESVNVINAIKVAKAKGLRTIGLTGTKPNTIQTLVEINLSAAGETTAEIQTTHQLIYHCLCEMLETYFFGGK